MNDKFTGETNLFLCFISNVFAWVTLHDVQVFMTLIATMVSISTGVMACIFYYKRIKSKKIEKGIE